MVSVVIPVYKVADYIERCILSVMSQSYTEIECIIVDDASPDDSMEICERLIQDYEGPIQFKIIHHESNRGLSAARNTGTAESKGEWIYYLDSDDDITSDCLEKLVAVASNHPDAEMVMGDYERIEAGNSLFRLDKSIQSEFHTNEEVFASFLKGELPINAWNKLIKRSFLSEHQLFFIEGIIYEDTPWAFFVYKHLSELYICKEVTYHWYTRPNSIITASKKDLVGVSFSKSYDVILNNLTPGRESKELELYVNGFCKRYLAHKTAIPAYSDLMKKYKKLSKVYNDRKVLLKLNATQLLPFKSIVSKMIERLESHRHRA